MEMITSVAILAAALGSGLIAGVFLAFSTFVMAGLKAIPAAQGIAAMQSINVTVIRSLFMVIFVATGLISAGLIAQAALAWEALNSVYLLTGGLAYLVGCVLVTGGLNVPLNNRLAAVLADTDEAAQVWADYQRDWVMWNHVRTAFSSLACGLFIVAIAS